MRYGTGTDGSDIMRTTRQQYLIKSLFNEAISKNLFTQTSQLYQLVRAAINSLSISEGMADTAALVGLAMSLRNMPLDHLYMQTVPITAAPTDPNRVVWAPDADDVWNKFREDKPLFSTEDTTQPDANGDADGTDAPASPSETPSAAPSETADPSQQDSPAATPAPTIDPLTGLIKQHDGTLIDPETGGIVDPETGAIKDPDTNQYVGIAYQYLNSTVCAVPATKQ